MYGFKRQHEIVLTVFNYHLNCYEVTLGRLGPGRGVRGVGGLGVEVGMIVLVCKLYPQDERLEFTSPEDAAEFLCSFVPHDFVLEIDGNSYSWEDLRLANGDIKERTKELEIIMDHLDWCLEIDEAFYKE